MSYTLSHQNWLYRQVSNIRSNKSQNLNVSHLVLQLLLRNLLKPAVKSKMKRLSALLIRDPCTLETVWQRFLQKKVNLINIEKHSSPTFTWIKIYLQWWKSCSKLTILLAVSFKFGKGFKSHASAKFFGHHNSPNMPIVPFISSLVPICRNVNCYCVVRRTVRCRSSAFNFPQNFPVRHPAARTWGRDMDVFCEYKIWLVFCLSYWRAVCNIMLYRAAL